MKNNLQGYFNLYLNTTLCIGSIDVPQEVKDYIAGFKYNTLYRFNL